LWRLKLIRWNKEKKDEKDFEESEPKPELEASFVSDEEMLFELKIFEAEVVEYHKKKVEQNGIVDVPNIENQFVQQEETKLKK